jgi:thiol-disulfide isomerase/thioredoxin
MAPHHTLTRFAPNPTARALVERSMSATILSLPGVRRIETDTPLPPLRTILMPIASWLLLTVLQTPPAVQRPFELMVGDAAPPLRVAEWVQGAPVERFAPGQIYVVEFWATWCGPCKVAIPHLNQLQKKHGDKVRFVGVSIWEHLDDEPYSVPEFVRAMGDQMTYTVASDRKAATDEAFMAQTWMEKSGQGGIPTSFVVDGNGKIAWIGYPMTLDAPLEEIVAGRWDLAAAAAKYASDLELKGLAAKISKDVTKAKKAKDWEGALRHIDGAIAQHPGLEASFGVDKYFLLLEAQRPKDAAAYGRRLVSDVLGKSSGALNMLAWTIVDPQNGRKDGDWALAVLAAERAVELTRSEDANVLDTLGLALFRNGEVERAIKIQERAVELSHGSAYAGDMKARLDEFRAGKTGRDV